MRSTSTGLLGVAIGLGAIASAFAADMPIKAPKMPVYKAPRRVCLVESLPRTASGKILKRVLRDKAREAIATD